jgi:hypothetical protein
MILMTQFMLAFIWTGDQVMANVRRFDRQYSVKHCNFDGIWTVETQTIDGRNPSCDDEGNLRWSRLAFDRKRLLILDSTGSRLHLRIEPEISPMPVFRGEQQVAELTFATQPNDKQHAILLGLFFNKAISCKLRAVPQQSLPLLSDKFSWISSDREN